LHERIASFKEAVRAQALRDFPWRRDTDPWGVLVSEFMLQQTQTERVIPYWERWMRKWSAPEALAQASLTDALGAWSGLGYNKRGRYVWECARIITGDYGGAVPDTPEALDDLPGIGAYSAGAIACFAYNYPSVFIETNIRAGALHFFFQEKTEKEPVRDGELLPLLSAAMDHENPRAWYWALMDYGAAVKKALGNPNRKSAHYTRQSPFEGSFRQRRGAVLKALVSGGPGSHQELCQRAGITEEELLQVLESLKKDNLL
jgi:A/G-specific adenine glycosylase